MPAICYCFGRASGIALIEVMTTRVDFFGGGSGIGAGGSEGGGGGGGGGGVIWIGFHGRSRAGAGSCITSFNDGCACGACPG